MPLHRILLIDDDDLLAGLLRHELTRNEFVVTVAPEGWAGLTAANMERPDVILLDGNMPGLDGSEVLRRLKRDEWTRDIPVIMMTARRQQDDVTRELKRGADDYIVKPVTVEALVARIYRLLYRET